MPTATDDRRLAQRRSADVIDVFAYVVVLGLAVQYLPQVISETFTLTLLTAVLLKVTLEIVLALKRPLKRRLTAAATPLAKAGALLVLWLLVVASKVVILEVVAWVFAGSVHLGGFFAVTGLVLALLAARAAIRWLLTEPQTT